MKRISISKISVAMILIFVLIISTVFVGFSEEQAAAADMRIIKTEGGVEITNDAGAKLPAIANMKLASGTHIKTDASGYAWIGLDETKFIKLDHSTDANVVKEGKLLKVNLDEGSIFFNVTSPLRSDEEMRIHTSTTITGIRGTMGEVSIVYDADRTGSVREDNLVKSVKITILEGATINTVVDKATGQNKSVQLSAGDEGSFNVYAQSKPGDKTDIIMDKLTNEKIPQYIVNEMLLDNAVAERAGACPGIDVPSLIEKARQAKASTSVSSAPRRSSGGGSGRKKSHTHSYTAKVTQEADCYNEEITTYTCSCGDTYDKVTGDYKHKLADFHYSEQDQSGSQGVIDPSRPVVYKYYKCKKCSECGEIQDKKEVSEEEYETLHVYDQNQRCIICN